MDQVHTVWASSKALEVSDYDYHERVLPSETVNTRTSTNPSTASNLIFQECSILARISQIITIPRTWMVNTALFQVHSKDENFGVLQIIPVPNPYFRSYVLPEPQERSRILFYHWYAIILNPEA